MNTDKRSGICYQCSFNTVDTIDLQTSETVSMPRIILEPLIYVEWIHWHTLNWKSACNQHLA